MRTAVILLSIVCLGLVFLLLTTFLFNENAQSDKEAFKPAIINIDSSNAIFDTLYINETGDILEKNPTIDKSAMMAPGIENFVVAYPPSTVEVAWYSVGHAPNGSALFHIVGSTGFQVSFLIEKPASVSAYSLLLQSQYLRFDTISKEIYAFKTPKRPF